MLILAVTVAPYLACYRDVSAVVDACCQQLDQLYFTNYLHFQPGCRLEDVHAQFKCPPPGKHVFIGTDNANDRHPAGPLLLFLGASALLEQMLAALPNVTPWAMQEQIAHKLRPCVITWIIVLAFSGRGAAAPITMTKTTGTF